MGVSLATSTPKAVYEYTGKNLAPVRPLDVIRGNPVEYGQGELCEQLIEKYQNYKQRDYQAWRDVVDIGQMVANSRLGKMLLVRNARDGRYLFVKRDGKFSNHKTVGGLFQFYSTKLIAEWLSSRPERDPVVPSQDDRIEEYISSVKIIQDNYDRKFFDDRYETLECLSAQDYGTWITRFRYDPYEKDIVCELLDFPACRWDVRFRAEESPYFIYESKCSTAKLEHILRGEISSDDTMQDQYGLQIIEQIARQGGNAEGYGKDRPWGEVDTVHGETIVTEMWLQPDEYCDIELQISEKTVSGVTLPKGNLIKTFPEGMCVVGINNMETIIGIHAENHKDHIVSGIYHAQSFSGIGKGVSDAVDVMKDLNDLHSQTLAYVKSSATPMWAYNQDLVTEQQARDIGKPGKVIPIDFKNAPEGVKSVNEAVQAVTPGNPGTSIFNLFEHFKDSLQMSFQVTTFADGMPGVDNKTATGAQIGASNERMMLVPQHRNKADHRKRADKVIFKLFQKYIDVPKYFSTRSINGLTKAKYFSNKEFDGVEVDFEIVADSEIPRTQFTKKQDLTAFLQFTGGVQGVIEAAQIDPEMTSAMADIFGADLPIAKPDVIAKVCRTRVDQAEKMLESEMQMQEMMVAVTGEMPDNSQLAEAIVSQLIPPIIPAEPHHQQKIMWLSLLLDDDEMTDATPEMREVVSAMILAHAEASAYAQGQMGAIASKAQMMAQQPMMEMQAAMQQQQMAAQQQAQAQQQQVQGQQAVEQQQLQAQAQMADKQAQDEMADRQAGRQLQLEAAKMSMDEERAELDHARQLELADKAERQRV